jgi:TolB-like protein
MGSTESIINDLAQLPNLKVTPRSALFRYKERKRIQLKRELSLASVRP